MLTTVAFLLLAGAAADANGKWEPPSVTLRSAGKDGSLTFEVANPNAESPPYVGYLPNSFEGGLKAGTIAPICRLELLHDGQWKDKKIGYCGTGIGPVSIPAKGKVTFQMRVPDGAWDQFRVGLTWYRAANQQEPTVAWSTGLSRKDVQAIGRNEPQRHRDTEKTEERSRIDSLLLVFSVSRCLCGSFLLNPLAADEPTPPVKQARVDARFVGRWMATFQNGVVESCEVRDDATAAESETLRSADGQVSQQGGSIVIRFADDRVERWTPVGRRMVVEHWCPAAAYPAEERVVGIADRVQP